MSSSHPNKFISTGNWADFGTVILLDLAIFLGIFLLFCILRRSQRYRAYFAPLVYRNVDPTKPQPPNSTSLFGWIPTTIGVSDDSLFELRGLDAVMKIVSIRTFIFMFLCILPVSIAVLVTNATGGQGVGGVPRLSIANVARGNRRLWAPVVCGYAFTLIALYFLYRAYKKFEMYSAVENMKLLAHNFTALVRDVPQNANLVGPTVTAVHHTVKAKKLRRLIRKKQLLMTNHKYLMDEQHATGVAPVKKRGCFKTVDAVADNEKKMQKIDAKILAIRSAGPLESTTSAFLTFQSMREAWETARGNNEYLKNAFPAGHFLPAPYVNDVNWDALAVPRPRRVLGFLIAVVLIIVLLLFWLVPVAFAQALANMNNLGKGKVGFLSGTQNWASIPRGLVQGFLPPLVLVVFYAMLPVILRKVNNLRAPASQSRLDRQVLGSFYAFKLINVFLVSAFFGGVLNVLHQIQQHHTKSQMADLIGSSVPAQSLFFINLVLAFTFIAYPIAMIRAAEIPMAFFGRKKTPGEKAFRERPTPRRYATTGGIELLVFTIGIVYVFLAPFIVPFVILFFAIAYLHMKHEALYVIVPRFQGKGQFWHTYFNCAIASILVAHVLLILCLALRGFPEVAAIAPMPIVTVVFALWCKARFHKSCNYLPAQLYPETDKIPSDGRFNLSYVDPASDMRRDTMDLEMSEVVDNELEHINYNVPLVNAGSAQV